MELTPELIARIRRQCTRRLDVPLAAFAPASGRVLIMHDHQRPGTPVFRIIGTPQPICIIWEDEHPGVARIKESNLTPVATVA